MSVCPRVASNLRLLLPQIPECWSYKLVLWHLALNLFSTCHFKFVNIQARVQKGDSKAILINIYLADCSCISLSVICWDLSRISHCHNIEARQGISKSRDLEGNKCMPVLRSGTLPSDYTTSKIRSSLFWFIIEAQFWPKVSHLGNKMLTLSVS